MMKAIIIDLIHPSMRKEDSMERLEELEQLVNTYGGIVVVKKYQKRLSPHGKTFIGPGKVEEIAQEGKELGVSLLIVNDILKPRQTYLLGETLRPVKIDVWDRIDLILKIFAKHARTTEARLEIELASIRHMGPRIFGMGMELSRQGGGIGTVGIGEKNTEIMKRHLRGQEMKVKERIEKYKQVRKVHKESRQRRGLKTVSLIGYTNAGKTSLLNTLTGRKEYADDKLFATLDTRVGELFLPERRQKVLLSDTIGFIKHLPPELIHAFESTLSEAMDADLLLHVIDISDPKWEEKITVVEDILEKLGVKNKPTMHVYNKIDAISSFSREQIKERFAVFHPVFVSAHTKDGFPSLTQEIENVLFPLHEKK